MIILAFIFRFGAFCFFLTVKGHLSFSCFLHWSKYLSPCDGTTIKIPLKNMDFICLTLQTGEVSRHWRPGYKENKGKSWLHYCLAPATLFFFNTRQVIYRIIRPEGLDYHKSLADKGFFRGCSTDTIVIH